MSLLLYLSHRFYFRIVEFFRHWYIVAPRNYSHAVILLLEKFDQTLAWKITLQNIFEPLYQDRSLIGYILGFIFRTIRLVVGAAIYIIIIALAVLFCVLWLLLPIYILYKIFSSLIH